MHEITLENVPRIGDVEVMVEIFRYLGGTAEYIKPDTLKLCGKGIHKSEISADLAKKVRTSFLFAAPLLARFKKAKLHPPGGDVIGRRGLHCHYQGLEELGAEIRLDLAYQLGLPNGFTGRSIFLDEPSVTGTEQIIMAAVLAQGTTEIQNAASEPHVQNLCRALNSWGAQISGMGTTTLTIRGVANLQGGTHRVGADYIEMGSFITLALATGSELLIEGVKFSDYPMIMRMFARFGAKLVQHEQGILIPGDQKLEIVQDVSRATPVIADGPWPQFPTDLMSNIIVLATRSRGMVLIFEKMFDKRMVFSDLLAAVGANIIQCDPHRIVVSGPCEYIAGRFESPDIRAGLSLIIAALCAKGTSEISNIRQVDRGYEAIDRRLQALGADIRRVD